MNAPKEKKKESPPPPPVSVVAPAVVNVEEGVRAAMRVVPQRKIDFMLTGRFDQMFLN